MHLAIDMMALLDRQQRPRGVLVIVGQGASLLRSEVWLPRPAPDDCAVIVIVLMVIVNTSVSGLLLLLVGGLRWSVLSQSKGNNNEQYTGQKSRAKNVTYWSSLPHYVMGLSVAAGASRMKVRVNIVIVRCQGRFLRSEGQIQQCEPATR